MLIPAGSTQVQGVPKKARPKAGTALKRGARKAVKSLVDSVKITSSVGSAIATPALAVIGSTAASALSLAVLPTILIPPLGLNLIPATLNKVPDYALGAGSKVGHRLGQVTGGTVGLGVGIPVGVVSGVSNTFFPNTKKIFLSPREQQKLLAADYPKEPQGAADWRVYRRDRTMSRIAGLGLGLATGALAGVQGGWLGAATGALVGGAAAGFVHDRVGGNKAVKAALGGVLTATGAALGATQSGTIAAGVGALAGGLAMVGLSDVSFVRARGRATEERRAAQEFEAAVKEWERLNPLPQETEVVFSENEIDIGDITLERQN